MTCEGVAVLGASQPQLSVHDSGNSKLGYMAWPASSHLAAAGVPYRDIVTALAAPSPPQPPCHQKRNQNPPRMWRVVTLETVETGDTLLLCSAAVLQAGSPPRARASVQHGNHRCIFSHRRRDMSRKHRAVWRYSEEETWKLGLGHWNDKPALSLEIAPNDQ